MFLERTANSQFVARPSALLSHPERSLMEIHTELKFTEVCDLWTL